MRKVLFLSFTLLVGLTDSASAHISPSAAPTPVPIVQPPPMKPFMEPFTGRVTRNRVRIRVGADLNSPIVREVDHSTLLSVVGEDNGFYAIKPPKDIWGYVYRNYILDNVVDGANVNVRLEPSLDGIVLTQLNKGDRIDGKVSPLNSRWLEIQLPQSVRFYVAKDFIEKAGGADLLQRLQARRAEAYQKINDAFQAGQAELQKSLEEVNLEGPLSDLHKVALNYSDLSDEVAQVKRVIAALEESYRQKKLGLLGPQASLPPPPLIEPAPQPQPKPESEKLVGQNSNMHANLSVWYPQEMQLFEEWQAAHPEQTLEDFYAEQRIDAIQMRGVLQPYTRQVKNKPGNYLLISHQDNQPIAYLYSTQVDLQPKVGQIVSVVGLSRPNHNFAFPAFFVVSAE